MIVTPIKTEKVVIGYGPLNKFLEKNLPKINEECVLIVTSKIVSLCEHRVVSTKDVTRDELVIQESDLYLPRRYSKWNFELTLTQQTLIMSAGIDESNSGGEYYVLWPINPQKSANDIRDYLLARFKLKNVGVIITDSTCTPMRWGTTGLAIAYSGFEPTNSYIGKPDLFGRKLKVSKSNVAGGLASAGVVSMGEGDEQTPLAIVSNAPFIKFQDRAPTQAELDNYFITDTTDDVFAPLLNGISWQKGGRGQK